MSFRSRGSSSRIQSPSRPMNHRPVGAAVQQQQSNNLSLSTPNLSSMRGSSSSSYHPKPHDCGVTHPTKYKFKASPMPDYYGGGGGGGGSLQRKKSPSANLATTTSRDTHSSEGSRVDLHDFNACPHDRPFYPPGPQPWAEFDSIHRLQEARRLYSRPENRKLLAEQSPLPKSSQLHRKLSLPMKPSLTTTTTTTTFAAPPGGNNHHHNNSTIEIGSNLKNQQQKMTNKISTVQSIKASSRSASNLEIEKNKKIEHKNTQTELTMVDLEKIIGGKKPYSELIVNRFPYGQGKRERKEEQQQQQKSSSLLMQTDSLDDPQGPPSSPRRIQPRTFGNLNMELSRDLSTSQEPGLAPGGDSSAAEAESIGKDGSNDDDNDDDDDASLRADAVAHSPTVFEDSLDILLNDGGKVNRTTRPRIPSSASSKLTTDGAADLPKDSPLPNSGRPTTTTAATTNSSNTILNTDPDNISYWLHKSIFFQDNSLFKPNAVVGGNNGEEQLRRSAVEISTSKEYRSKSDKLTTTGGVGGGGGRKDVVISSVYYPMRKEFELHLGDEELIVPKRIIRRRPDEIESGSGIYLEETNSKVGIVQLTNGENENNKNWSSSTNSSTSSFAALPKVVGNNRNNNNAGNRTYPSTIYVTTGNSSGIVKNGPQSGTDTQQLKQEEKSGRPGEESNRIGGIKSRFEHENSLDGGNDENSKGGSGKRPARVYYAGLQSAKTKFMEEATRIQQQPVKSDKPKRITPPREGVNAGVLESKPQERDPNIVCYGEDDLEKEIELAKKAPTKNVLAKFKEMEAGKSIDDDRVSSSKVIDDLDPATTKSALAKWKTIETQKDTVMTTETAETRKFKIKSDEGQGGVYENQPQVRDDVIRESDNSVDLEKIAVNTKELRSQFLRHASDTNSNHVVKLDPLMEIQLLSQREKTTVYENAPKDRLDGIVTADQSQTADPIITSNAKELREKFSNPQQSTEIKKKPIQLAEGDGGIFENVPVRLEGVVRWEDQPELTDEEQHSKWASDAKMRFIQEAQKAATPKEKKDGIVNGVDESNDGRYASDAKKRILEMQKAAEEKEKEKKTPGIINIWDELCEYSGVFENNPTERQKDVITAYDDQEEEELAKWQAHMANQTTESASHT